MEDMLGFVRKEDLEITSAIEKELNRQRNTIELIASENFTSLAVMQAQGTWLTNKYAEGLPHKRYYGGCEFVDDVEDLAIARAKKLFGADHANVQPHSGAQANMAVYFALVKPGDTVLGMNLSQGGHLTHGSPVNISGMYYNVIPYGLNTDELIDYEEVEKLALQHRPKMIVAGASAYPRIIDFKRFREIADKVGAKLCVDMAHIAGLVAAGLHPSPVPHAHVVTTTTHKTLRGPRGGMILCKEEFAKDINKAVFPGIQGGPLMHVIAAKALSFKEALHPSFKTYQEQILKNSNTLAETLVSYQFRLVSGGTDNHLILVDLQTKGFTGKEAETVLDEVGITVNKNAIPNDPASPFVTSGIRVGTPAATARGFKEHDMKTIGALIAATLKKDADLDTVRAEVQKLCAAFPLYPEIK